MTFVNAQEGTGRGSVFDKDICLGTRHNLIYHVAPQGRMIRGNKIGEVGGIANGEGWFFVTPVRKK